MGTVGSTGRTERSNERSLYERPKRNEWLDKDDPKLGGWQALDQMLSQSHPSELSPPQRWEILNKIITLANEGDDISGISRAQRLALLQQVVELTSKWDEIPHHGNTAIPLMEVNTSCGRGIICSNERSDGLRRVVFEWGIGYLNKEAIELPTEVYTPYGHGLFIKERTEDDIVEVKFPFGTAFLHKDSVVKTGVVFDAYHQLQHPVEVVGPYGAGLLLNIDDDTPLEPPPSSLLRLKSLSSISDGMSSSEVDVAETTSKIRLSIVGNIGSHRNANVTFLSSLSPTSSLSPISSISSISTQQDNDEFTLTLRRSDVKTKAEVEIERLWTLDQAKVFAHEQASAMMALADIRLQIATKTFHKSLGVVELEKLLDVELSQISEKQKSNKAAMSEVVLHEQKLIREAEEKVRSARRVVIAGHFRAAAAKIRHHAHVAKEKKDAKLAKKRNNVLQELVQSESNYLGFLKALLKTWEEPLGKLAEKGSGITRADHALLFSNLRDIAKKHEGILTGLQEASDKGAANVAGSFAAFHDCPKLYSIYAANYDVALTVFAKLSKSKKKKIQAILNKRSERNNLGLADHLIMPVQRLPKYRLLLENAVTFSKAGSAEETALRLALNALSDVAESVNIQKRVEEEIKQMIQLEKEISWRNVGRELKICEKGRRLILMSKPGEIWTFPKGSEVLLILFNDKIIWTTPLKRVINHQGLLDTKVTTFIPEFGGGRHGLRLVHQARRLSLRGDVEIRGLKPPRSSKIKKTREFVFNTKALRDQWSNALQETAFDLEVKREMYLQENEGKLPQDKKVDGSNPSSRRNSAADEIKISDIVDIEEKRNQDNTASKAKDFQENLATQKTKAVSEKLDYILDYQHQDKLEKLVSRLDQERTDAIRNKKKAEVELENKKEYAKQLKQHAALIVQDSEHWEVEQKSVKDKYKGVAEKEFEKELSSMYSLLLDLHKPKDRRGHRATSFGS